MSACSSESGSRSRQDSEPSFETPSEGLLQTGGTSRLFLELNSTWANLYAGGSLQVGLLRGCTAAQRMTVVLCWWPWAAPQLPWTCFVHLWPGMSLASPLGARVLSPAYSSNLLQCSISPWHARWDRAGVERDMLTYLSLSWEPYPCRAWASVGPPSCTGADGGTPFRRACGVPPCPGAALGCLLCPAACEVLVVQEVGTGAPEVAAAWSHSRHHLEQTSPALGKEWQPLPAAAWGRAAWPSPVKSATKHTVGRYFFILCIPH